MSVSILARGIMIGFSIAAPVGPIGVLCIRRTLAEGRLCGLASGLGAATADAFYGSISGFGLTFLSSFLVGQQAWLRLVGGAFLCGLGLRIYRARPAAEAARAVGNGLAAAYASTLLLTLTNPLTILSFFGIFAGLGVVGGTRGHHAAAGWLILGVFLGSCLWWCVLSGTVGLMREQVTPGALRWVNRISGGLIMAFGIMALLSWK